MLKGIKAYSNLLIKGIKVYSDLLRLLCNRQGFTAKGGKGSVIVG